MPDFMKFKLEKNKVQMEISVENLIKLFEENPWNNLGAEPFATVRTEKKEEFVKAFLSALQEESDISKVPVWGLGFEKACEIILESCADFLKYHDETEEI